MTDTSILEAPDDEAIEDSPVHVTPVPVTGVVGLAGRVDTSEEAADFGAYRTIVLTGTEEKQQILPYDKRRVRAYVIVSGTGPVWVGSEEQCVAVRAGNTQGGGAQLVSGNMLTVGHKQPLWLVGDGSHTATVVVVQERNRE